MNNVYYRYAQVRGLALVQAEDSAKLRLQVALYEEGDAEGYTHCDGHIDDE